MSEHETVTRADIVRGATAARLERDLCRIAAARASELALEFRRRFPRRSLCVRFGNGTELVEIDGRDFRTSTRSDPRGYFCLDSPRTFQNLHHSDRRARAVLQFVADGIEDIRDICGHYGDACPSDIMVNPRLTRKL